ncbi:MAG TPA: hypothetical protein PLK11_05555 [Methanofastidiosum sp.]|nr:hypothetical protein [Methanofastidiosum sp.]HOR88689.1 hypothetical protein [Methanofastidiosum sp.]HOT85105.1 hypothetical protein [Methanofastidiosum sp.]HPL00798.1 hypothetical protein [Methanofastidiosum sp.]HQF90381.1 hypothetical protein [Methanofastidiosum sp.]
MKKIFAVLISLLFVASVFGVASLSATDKATATPERVKVGQIITVTSTYNPCAFNDTPPKCYDPTIKIYDPSIKNKLNYPYIFDLTFEEFQDASSYVTKLSGPIKTSDGIWTWTYRANFQGTIVFGAPYHINSPPEYRLISNPVTITSNSLPMDKFFKLFGFGKKK